MIYNEEDFKKDIVIMIEQTYFGDNSVNIYTITKEEETTFDFIGEEIKEEKIGETIQKYLDSDKKEYCVNKIKHSYYYNYIQNKYTKQK